MLWRNYEILGVEREVMRREAQKIEPQIIRFS
jgi:hypothetical protein